MSALVKVGRLLMFRGHRCRVFKVRPLGTIDIESLDSNHAWRLSGLPEEQS